VESLPEFTSDLKWKGPQRGALRAFLVALLTYGGIRRYCRANHETTGIKYNDQDRIARPGSSMSCILLAGVLGGAALVAVALRCLRP
jgi:hypothetical protein